MKKIVIIGAGPAGLTAAFELLRRTREDGGLPVKDEFEVIILEETEAIGGISRTVRYKDNRMDIGGHRFFSKDSRVMDWWTSLMPLQGSPSYDDKKLGRESRLAETGPDPEKEDRVMLSRRRISRIYYNRKFFDYPISMTPQTFMNMGFVQTVKAGFSFLAASLHKLPETSLENFYINRFGRVLYSMFFEGYTEKLWGRHPREISADWGAQRVKGLSITAIIKDIFSKLLPGGSRKVETSLIEEFIYPKYGPGQLWEIVA
ncbi:MAG: NAD(P)-binding protein, partial [Clostridiales bacterium]|nr:NAD(P)-binding protein [Clostridiales bacterium]